MNAKAHLTGRPCHVSGWYRTACPCCAVIRQARDDKFPACPKCQRSVRWFWLRRRPTRRLPRLLPTT